VVEDELEEESVEDVESVLVVLDESLLPSGGGGGPPAPFALLEKVLENTFFNSLAWSLVSLPLDTSLWMRSSILDCISSGEGGDEELELELDAPLFIAESMSSSAEESADSSLELIVPAETSLVSSLLRRSSGE
jgi:hypothetical protein